MAKVIFAPIFIIKNINDLIMTYNFSYLLLVACFLLLLGKNYIRNYTNFFISILDQLTQFEKNLQKIFLCI